MKMTAPTRPAEPTVRVVAGPSDPAVVLQSCAGADGLFALESACNTSGYGRYTIMGFGPLRRFERRLDGAATSADQAFCGLARSVLGPRVANPAAERFAGAWIGCLAYETGAALERVTRPEPAVAMRFALYDTAAVYDHFNANWRICAVDLPQSETPAADRADRLAEIVRSARTPTPPAAADPAAHRLVANMTKAAYLDKVRRAIAYIAAGDIYQVNLTQRFTTTTALTPFDLYLRLRLANPADFAAYLPWGETAVLSCSPELFLDVAQDGRVVTRPIKGTRPRGGDPAADAIRQAELLASEKDRAELNMIVDLLRNDLGKVCAFGSVRVLADRDVEVHPTVLHLVATIEGRLRAGVSPVDLLRATFPGGSITGCPKIRAMQIIRELEPTPRGPYCGAIGMIGLDGTLLMSVAIRTMVYDAGRLHLHAGGAITADSDPEAEYRETLAKAEGMFRALGCSTGELAEAPAVPGASR